MWWPFNSSSLENRVTSLFEEVDHHLVELYAETRALKAAVKAMKIPDVDCRVCGTIMMDIGNDICPRCKKEDRDVD